ncbi:MAG: homocysteine S-methyltransferase family protein [Patescibacteria group bacterium]
MKKQIKVNKVGILERLEKDIVLGAEGYVFELEKRGYIKAGPYIPEVVLDFPEAVTELHREFYRAGSEVMVALTYYASRNQLQTLGRENELEKLNRQAVRIANKTAKEYGGLVAGNISNTWMYDSSNKEASTKIVRKMYQEQLKWASEEGVDFVISETNDFLEEALIALEVIKEFGLPAMVTLASVQKDKTRDGYDYVEACKILEANGADIVGLNCDRGPATMFPIIEKIRQQVSCSVAMQPVPFRTSQKYLTFESMQQNGKGAYPIALEPFQLDRFAMAAFAKKAKQIGVNYIGGCCGNTPAYTRAMAEALGRTVTASRYSPAIELHPMAKEERRKKDTEFVDDWQLV